MCSSPFVRALPSRSRSRCTLAACAREPRREPVRDAPTISATPCGIARAARASSRSIPSTTELLFAIGAGESPRRSHDVRHLARRRARGPRSRSRPPPERRGGARRAPRPRRPLRERRQPRRRASPARGGRPDGRVSRRSHRRLRARHARARRAHRRHRRRARDRRFRARARSTACAPRPRRCRDPPSSGRCTTSRCSRRAAAAT